MKLLPLFILLIFSLATPLRCAQEDNTPIVVSLETDVQLLPVHVGKIINENSAFDSSYLDKLSQNFKL